MESKYKKYPEYKDCGVEWIGNIPLEWTYCKFGNVKKLLTDYTANGSFASLKENVTYLDEPSFARLVRLTDLRKNLNNEDGVWIDEKSYNFLSKSSLMGGEFLLANVGAHAGLFYQMPMNTGPASLAPNMFMAKFDSNKVNECYMAYIGQSYSVNSQLRLKATASSAQPKLNKDDFKSIYFTYPTISEQVKIADFLDYETSKIDTLIEKQERLIELLKEKRQAVISHAVTKGLNPDAPMKDSGVEWLGEVPEHWEIKRIKSLSSIISKGTTPSTIGKDFVEKGIRFLKGENIGKDKFVKESPEFYITKDTDEQIKRSRLKENDVLVIIAGATTGMTSIVQKNILPANTNQAVSFIRPKNNNNSAWLQFWLSIEFTQRIIWMGAVQAAQPNLSMESLGNIPIVEPPIQEMKQILHYIDQKLCTLDDLLDKTKKAISIVKERRTSLISAAVTGTIDVRDWKKPE